MRLPSKRVQHRRDNVTTSNMQEYLCLHSVFEKIFRDHWFNQQSITTKQHRRPTPFGVQLLLNISMDRVDMRSTVLQRQFLHSQVRLTRAELLDLLCMRLQVPPTLATYTSMSDLRWTFGTQINLENGISYTIAPSPSCESEKSNVFLLKGSEPVGIINCVITRCERPMGRLCQSSHETNISSHGSITNQFCTTSPRLTCGYQVEKLFR